MRRVVHWPSKCHTVKMHVCLFDISRTSSHTQLINRSCFSIVDNTSKPHAMLSWHHNLIRAEAIPSELSSLKTRIAWNDTISAASTIVSCSPRRSNLTRGLSVLACDAHVVGGASLCAAIWRPFWASDSSQTDMGRDLNSSLPPFHLQPPDTPPC